ncbi:MAG: FAD-dependent monooxygenase [Ilumatobacteraceae bacterium]
MNERVDIAVIGGGPAGAATAIRAARAGASVVVFEKGAHGRDKICGDGLTPRAVKALNDLEIPLTDAHHIDGLRMIAGKRERELPWSDGDRFPSHGAVWPRRRLDAALIGAAIEAGADVRFETEAEPVFGDDGAVVRCARHRHRRRRPRGRGDGCAGQGRPDVLGAERDPNEPYGLAIRSYVESPRHDDALIEACLTIKDEHGTWVPGYGWMFPCGDGTVSIGVGALSTMQGSSR